MRVSKTLDRGSIPRAPAKLRPAMSGFLLGHGFVNLTMICQQGWRRLWFEDQGRAQKLASSTVAGRIGDIPRTPAKLTDLPIVLTERCDYWLFGAILQVWIIKINYVLLFRYGVVISF